MNGTSADSGDLLCVILDLNPLAWSLSSQQDPITQDTLSLETALDQFLIFANAHLALRHENQIAVFGAGFESSKLLYSSLTTAMAATTTTSLTSSARDAHTYQQFRVVDDGIAHGVRKMMQDQSEDDIGKAEIGMVGALAKALCHVNRLNSTSSLTPNLNKPRPRILILSVTDDASTQYVSTMNCIFTAQKNSIPIDVCKIFGRDAVFMQQACHLTGGSYFKLKERQGLLQYLIMTFLPGASARKHLNLPTQDHVDLRAACFCHRKIVDLGYVCSVCLSIFCSPVPVCVTCRTKFPMATLKRFGFGARTAAAANGNGNGRPKKRKAPSNNEAVASLPAAVA